MSKITTAKRRPSSDITVVIRSVPKGQNWGWFPREDPRMHLQSVEQKYDFKVWLESDGRRVFEPVGKIPAAVLKRLSQEVAEHRKFIETRWVSFMIRRGWLEMHIALPEITLIAYPNYPHRFVRKYDLTPDFAPKYLATLTPDIIELNQEMGSLRLSTDRTEDQVDDIRLSTILCQD
jgi:hypothetical protein